MTESSLYLLDTSIISDMMRNPGGRAAQCAIAIARQNGDHRMKLAAALVEIAYIATKFIAT